MSKKKKKSIAKSNHQQILKGKLEISRSGMGFVIVDGQDKDVLVRPNDFGKAFNGDVVRVEVPRHGSPQKRMEGKVIDVVERKQNLFSGKMIVTKEVAFFEPSGDKPIPDFFIPKENLNGAQHDDRVIVKMLRWAKEDRKPLGQVESVIGADGEIDLAMKEILIEAGFPLEFDEEVMQEVKALSENITDEDLKKRRDCRHILTFTIDPVDARDFDDALSIRKLNNGHYEIGVHIADVSHFVRPGSSLDKTAYTRATSVYLPDRVNPMLPEKISNELCSLRPHEDKFTFSAIFEISREAKIVSRWIGRSLIHSDHRFTYEEVQQIIESGEGKYLEEIKVLDGLAKQFRQKRFDKGAINFSSTEVRFKLDEQKKPIGIVVKESKDAHKLIEEFMLLANRAVAEFVSKIEVNEKPVPFPYRIHDTPSEEKLLPFAAFARKFGYSFDTKDEKQVAASFNRLLIEVKDKPEQHVLEQLGIRTMAKAIYTGENIGHYGLGFDNYCHFTSPIRRYPDVLVHRILQQCLDQQIRPQQSMEQWCKHCSDMERAAMEAERAGNKYMQVLYLKQFLGDEFDAVISGVSHFGFWAETVAHKCEGLVSIKDLNLFDDFMHDETDYALVGRRTKFKFRMGDKVRIRVVAANLEKRQLDFEWVHSNQQGLVQASSKGKKKK
jgi:ribonuclease R